MKEQDTVNKERLVLINNNERRMIVRALGLLETALNVEEDVCSNDYKRSVRELANIFGEKIGRLNTILTLIKLSHWTSIIC